jgi:hypothetical protein
MAPLASSLLISFFTSKLEMAPCYSAATVIAATQSSNTRKASAVIAAQWLHILEAEVFA